MDGIDVDDELREGVEPVMLVVGGIQLVKHGSNGGFTIIDAVAHQILFIEIFVTIAQDLVCEITSLLFLLSLVILLYALLAVEVYQLLCFLTT